MLPMLLNLKSTLHVFATFLKLGLTSFGGPVAHIGFFRKELVEKQQWLSEAQFAQLFSLCQFLPGPASSQLGFLLGYKRAGLFGATAAFIAFTLPSALALILFAQYLPYLATETGQAAIHGLKLTAIIVVADAIVKMSKALCPDRQRVVIAMLCGALLLLLDSGLAQLLALTLGALLGAALCRTSTEANNALSLDLSVSKPLAYFSGFCFLGLLIAAWLLPTQSPLISGLQAFYHAGALVFGGGHVVLALLEQAFVEPGLISQADFLAGYGAAQAIPGPLFSVAAYIGSLLSTTEPVAAALLGLCAIFLPGFLLLLASVPMWQKLQHMELALSVIRGVNAAVLGILIATFFNPLLSAVIINHVDLLIILIGFLLLNRLNVSVLLMLTGCLLSQLILAWL